MWARIQRELELGGINCGTYAGWRYLDAEQLVWLQFDCAGFIHPCRPLADLGVALVSPNAYVLPFEVASVLLLAALIGAIVVAWDRR